LISREVLLFLFSFPSFPNFPSSSAIFDNLYIICVNEGRFLIDFFQQSWINSLNCLGHSLEISGLSPSVTLIGISNRLIFS